MDPGQGPGGLQNAPEDGAVATRRPRVVIAVPAHDHCHTMFAMDFGILTAEIANAQAHGKGVETFAVKEVTGTYVHRARQQLVDESLAEGADFILWLDSDMRFPRTLLWELMFHGVPMVGVNYATRSGVPVEYVALKQLGVDGKEARRCITGPDSTGLERVEAVGFGAVLTRRDVFEALHDPKGERGPWFWFKWLPDIQQQMGEDVYFCELVREAGFDIFVDHDLSKRIAHMGTLPYKLDHAFEFVDIIRETKREQADEQADEPKLEAVS